MNASVISGGKVVWLPWKEFPVAYSAVTIDIFGTPTGAPPPAQGCALRSRGPVSQPLVARRSPGNWEWVPLGTRL